MQRPIDSRKKCNSLILILTGTRIGVRTYFEGPKILKLIPSLADPERDLLVSVAGRSQRELCLYRSVA